MRPQSMRIFDFLFIGSVAIGLGNLIVTLADASIADHRRATLIAGAVFGAIIAITLWYLISRLRIGFFKWVLAVLVAFGLMSLRDTLADGIDVADVIGLVASVMQLAAVAILFRADARQWLAAPES